MLTLADLHAENLILFEAISGSHAYGLATPQSDTDIKGVFYLPRRLYYGLDYLPQISDAGNDTTYYELGRFVELLLASNPTALELLAAPPDTIRQRAPLMDALRPAWFLSKACQQTFAGYALGQIKKARGLNKKINAPVAAKTPLDFCHILDGARALPLAAWLARSGCEQRRIGLVRLAHARDLYAIYYDADGSRGYRGIQRHPAATGLCTESVAPDSAPLAYLSYNADGYSAHCRHFAEYQQWARERNPARYASTQAHGQGYDAKNLMHTIRLLETARDLARDGTLRVRRDNRDELLAIKHGAFTYDALLTRAEALMTESAALFAASSLPDAVDKERRSRHWWRCARRCMARTGFVGLRAARGLHIPSPAKRERLGAPSRSNNCKENRRFFTTPACVRRRGRRAVRCALGRRSRPGCSRSACRRVAGKGCGWSSPFLRGFRGSRR